MSNPVAGANCSSVGSGVLASAGFNLASDTSCALGTGGNDVIVGHGGSDRIDAGSGNDRVCGGSGTPDRCDGEGGSDTATACEQTIGVP